MPQQKLKVVTTYFITSLITLLTSNELLAAPIQLKEQKAKLVINNHSSTKAELILQTTGLKVIDLFKLTEPNRLVIDIDSALFSRSHTFEIPNSTLLRSIRTGRHPNITRIVFDIADSCKEYSYSNINSNSEFKVSLSCEQFEQEETLATATNIAESPLENIAQVSNSSSESTIDANESNAPLPQATITNQDTAIAETAPLKEIGTNNDIEQKSSAKKDLIAIKEETIFEEVLPEKESTATPTDTQEDEAESLTNEIIEIQNETDSSEKQEDSINIAKEEAINDEQIALDTSQPQLTSINFITKNGEMFIYFSFNKRSHFSFSKLTANEYKLTIPNCRVVAPYLLKPYFAPQDLTGVTYIVTKELNSEIEISIGIDKGTTLSAIPAGKNIFIKQGK